MRAEATRDSVPSMSHHRQPVTARARRRPSVPTSTPCARAGCCSAPGQIPLHPETGELVGANAAEQAGRCLENLQAVCAAAGASLADAVKITVYLRDMADFTAVNEVYGSFFETDPPARVAIVGRRRCRATRSSSSTRSSRCLTERSRARRLHEPADHAALLVGLGCHWTPSTNASPGRSSASGRPSIVAIPVTTRPSPTRSTPWWWWDFVPCSSSPAACAASEPGDEAHVVVGAVERAARLQVVVVAEALRQVLVQRAAERDVQQLHAAADPEHRHLPLDGAAHERELERVALGHRVDGRRVELGAVAGRVDVGAADEHQPVDQVERLVGLLDERRVGREQQRHARRRGGPRRGSSSAAAPPAGPTRSTARARARCRRR